MIFLDSSADLSGRRSYVYAARCESMVNVSSELSNKVSARPLLTTPPSPPTSINASLNGDYISLTWDDMLLQDGGIAGYLVSRRTETVNGDVTLPYSPLKGEKEPLATNFYTDSSTMKGYVYTYSVQSVDGTDKSLSKRLIVTASLNGSEPIAPRGLSLTNTNDGIKIEWGKTIYMGMASYNLYRHLPGQKAELVLNTGFSSTQFTDAKVKPGLNYFYYLTTLNDKGQESRHSEELSITR
jgi:fibronectin type 3 domain-containing protein